jgi:hypothetical protein
LQIFQSIQIVLSICQSAAADAYKYKILRNLTMLKLMFLSP